MREIPLTQGKVALVDDEDFPDISQFKWYALKGGLTFYARHALRCDGKRDFESMHRRILKCKPGQRVDHENHNGLDNQKHNIRRCTRSENNRNRKKQKNPTSSEFKGVHWDRCNGKWQAQIRKNGRNKHLGLFVSDVEAAHAYDVAARKIFGEFALTNFEAAQ